MSRSQQLSSQEGSIDPATGAPAISSLIGRDLCEAKAKLTVRHSRPVLSCACCSLEENVRHGGIRPVHADGKDQERGRCLMHNGCPRLCRDLAAVTFCSCQNPASAAIQEGVSCQCHRRLTHKKDLAVCRVAKFVNAGRACR